MHTIAGAIRVGAEPCDRDAVHLRLPHRKRYVVREALKSHYAAELRVVCENEAGNYDENRADDKELDEREAARKRKAYSVFSIPYSAKYEAL